MPVQNPPFVPLYKRGERQRNGQRTGTIPTTTSALVFCDKIRYNNMIFVSPRDEVTKFGGTMPETGPKLELSNKEKERRYTLLREKLKKAGLSGIIVYGGSQLGVPVHYLTGVGGTRMNA